MADEPRSFAQSDEPASNKPALGEGAPPGVDGHDIGERDNPQLAWADPGDEPEAEVAYGANHANRPYRTEATRGRGARTVQRMREIIKGRLYR